jgi:hypothetical protein
MKRFRSACRLAGATALLLLTGGCSSDRAPVRNLAACSLPRVDTAGWVRQAGPYPGFSYRIPGSFQEDTTGMFIHGGTRWVDGPRWFHQASSYWSPESFRGSYAKDPPEDPEYSECWDTIAGLRVFIATRYQEGKFVASAGFPNPLTAGGPRSLEPVLDGVGTRSQDQVLFLAIIRTIAPDSAP